LRGRNGSRSSACPKNEKKQVVEHRLNLKPIHAAVIGEAEALAL
jgi:hypothetical protein